VTLRVGPIGGRLMGSYGMVHKGACGWIMCDPSRHMTMTRVMLGLQGRW